MIINTTGSIYSAMQMLIPFMLVKLELIGLHAIILQEMKALICKELMSKVYTFDGD